MTQVSFTFTVTTAPGEHVADVLADLSTRLSGFATGPPPVADMAAPEGWTSDRADALIEPMTDFARGVVRYVAERAPKVPIADVVTHFALRNGQSLGGRMASLGFALNKVPGALNPLPAKGDHYVIDTEVARVLLDALDRHDATAR